MQNPSDQAEAFIPTESVTAINDDTNLNPTVTVRRKAAKRSERWYQTTSAPFPQNIAAALPLSPQAKAEAIPARKKPRLEEPLLPATPTTEDADRETPAPDVSGGLGPPTPPTATNDDANNAELVSDTLQNTGANEAMGRWTAEEDAELTSAVAKSEKKLWGKNHVIDWVAVAALVPGRSNFQCDRRWHVPGRRNIQCQNRLEKALNPSMALLAGRKGGWKEDEDLKLMNSVQMHGNKNWDKIASLVPDRTTKQCYNRWRNSLYPSIITTDGRRGTWTEDEDLKLKAAVQTHGDKDWVQICTLVPTRTRKQCWNRWKDVLDPGIALKAGRKGIWTDDEANKLKAAVQTHGDMNWGAIALLVPGRTKKQCSDKWYNALDPSIEVAIGNMGKWTEDEDLKLKKSVQMHGGKDWAAIAALVPSRSKSQCSNRWHVLDPSIAPTTTGRVGRWGEDEDVKLLAAAQMHGGKNWKAIAALVPDRTNEQCRKRWRDAFDPSIALTTGLTGKWTLDEDRKLEDAVHMHGDKDWAAVAALVPGRTKEYCFARWRDAFDCSIKPWPSG
jgi:hypothetical protein